MKTLARLWLLSIVVALATGNIVLCLKLREIFYFELLVAGAITSVFITMWAIATLTGGE